MHAPDDALHNHALFLIKTVNLPDLCPPAAASLPETSHSPLPAGLDRSRLPTGLYTAMPTEPRANMNAYFQFEKLCALSEDCHCNVCTRTMLFPDLEQQPFKKASFVQATFNSNSPKTKHGVNA